MKPAQTQRSPLGHRLLIYALSGMLLLLVVWLMQFILSDIGDIRGPDWAKMEKESIDQKLIKKQEDLEKKKGELQGNIKAQREKQAILETSAANSEQTMNQLVALHKLNLEKGVTPTTQEQQALAESEAQFLDNQRAFQAANSVIAQLSEEMRQVDQDLSALNKQLDELRKPLRETFNKEREKHLWRLAAIKLAAVVPLLFLTGAVALRKRGSAYAPMANAVFCALFWTTGDVMYQCFPREYFKYIAIGAALAVVLVFLFYLIRMISAPKREWVLKQRREAYNQRRCPTCGFPIQRGPLKDVVWSRRGPRGLLPIPQTQAAGVPEAYTCPACGEPLFVSCPQCAKIRHALLPYCEHCGAASEESA